ncbi:MAG: response regulator [Candidatus Hydrogenedentales bacterium]
MRYLAAVGFTAFGLWLRHLMSPVLELDTPIMLNIATVTLSALVGGFGPGLLATALSILGAMYFFIPPLHSFELEELADSTRLFIFGLECILISAVCALWRVARQRAERRAEAEHALQLEHRQAREALRESEERFRAAFHRAGVGMVRAELDGRFTDVNERLTQMLGRTRDELLDSRFTDMLHAQDAPAFEEEWNRLCKGASDLVSLEKRYQHKDGKIVWGLTDAALVRDASGRPHCVIGAVQDITDRHHAESLLRGHVEMLDVLNRVNTTIAAELDVSKIVQLVTDAGRLLSQGEFGAFIYSSPRNPGKAPIAYSLSGVSEDEFVALSGSALNRRLARMLTTTDVVRIGDVQQIDGVSVEERDAGAATRVRSYLAAPVVSRSGKIFGALFYAHSAPHWFTPQAEQLIAGLAGQAAVAMDNARLYDAAQREIAEHARIEKELKELTETLEARVAKRTAQLQERAGQLRAFAQQLTRTEEMERRKLADALHDNLQQIITSAVMRLGVLQRGVPQERQQALLRELEGILRDAIRETRSLTVQLSPPVLQHSGLTSALEWLAVHMQERHGLLVHMELAPGGGESEDIKGFLFNAVRELLFNVSKHAGTNEAWVTLKRNDGTLTVRVADRGKGCDPEVLEQRSSANEGFGLFSITERIQGFGGTVKQGLREGGGFLVELTVPLSREAIAHDEKKAPEKVGSDKRLTEQIRLLLVEDHAIVRQGLVSMLHDHQNIQIVGEADNGRSAVELAHQLQPNVIIMDVNMPVMNGIEATRAIAGALPKVQIIGLSVNNDRETSQAMRDAGAVDYLPKDGPADDLVTAIHRASSRAHSHAAQG